MKLEISLKKIKKVFQYVFDFFVGHAFLLFLLFVLFDFAIGSVVFYLYTFPSPDDSYIAETRSFKLDRQSFNYLLDELDSAKNSFVEADSGDYPDLFSSQGAMESELEIENEAESETEALLEGEEEISAWE